MAREDREAWERLEAEAADEACMQELRRQHPELVEADRTIFFDAEIGEVGPEDEEIDVDEWRSAFPNDLDDGTGPDPARGTPYMTRKDWLDLYFDRK